MAEAELGVVRFRDREGVLRVIPKRRKQLCVKSK